MNEWINCVQDQIRSACLSVCVGQAIFSAFAHFKLRFSFFIYFFGLFYQQHIHPVTIYRAIEEANRSSSSTT